MKKQSLAWALALVLILSSSFAALASGDQMTPSLQLTLEELAKFNGQDGQPAYVAVNGVIYDVSASGAWKEGQHKGIKAGQDVTEAFSNSPHDTGIFGQAVEVGKLSGIELTLEELAMYNGQDGQPAYITVNGIIYDVSALGTWENGQHKGIKAGQDVTEAFANSPHDAAILSMAVEAGKLKGLELTLDELAKFNGKDGQRAYVAVDGIIYDVTNSNAWKNGQHNGFEAGKDLTQEIKNVSPHGISKLANVVEVGKLVTK